MCRAVTCERKSHLKCDLLISDVHLRPSEKKRLRAVLLARGMLCNRDGRSKCAVGRAVQLPRHFLELASWNHIATSKATFLGLSDNVFQPLLPSDRQHFITKPRDLTA